MRGQFRRSVPHLIAVAGCLFVFMTADWLAMAGTVERAPTVIYFDMARTMQLTPWNKIDRCLCHLSRLPMAI